jgi:hypothetical protein
MKGSGIYKIYSLSKPDRPDAETWQIQRTASQNIRLHMK